MSFSVLRFVCTSLSLSENDTLRRINDADPPGGGHSHRPLREVFLSHSDTALSARARA
jgi:hypothetical protein